jgi:hypothetical protein
MVAQLAVIGFPLAVSSLDGLTSAISGGAQSARRLLI